MSPLDVLLLVPQRPTRRTRARALQLQHHPRIAERHRAPARRIEAQPAGVTVLPDAELLVELVACGACRRRRARVERVRRLLTDRFADMAHRIYGPAYEQALSGCAPSCSTSSSRGIELAPALDVIQRPQPQAGVIFDDHNAEAALQGAPSRPTRQSRRWPAAPTSWLQAARLGASSVSPLRHRLDNGGERRTGEAAGLLGPSAPPITVVPNAIDATRYQLPVMARSRATTSSSAVDGLPAQRDAMPGSGAIPPLIRQNRPETTFAIIGQKPHPRLDSAARAAGRDDVGMVPAVEPYLAGATVYVMPLRMGSGTRLKLIEAMAAGAHRQHESGRRRLSGAAQPRVAGRRAAAFARAVLRLLENRDARPAHRRRPAHGRSRLAG